MAYSDDGEVINSQQFFGDELYEQITTKYSGENSISTVYQDDEEVERKETTKAGSESKMLIYLSGSFVQEQLVFEKESLIETWILDGENTLEQKVFETFDEKERTIKKVAETPDGEVISSAEYTWGGEHVVKSVHINTGEMHTNYTVENTFDSNGNLLKTLRKNPC